MTIERTVRRITAAAALLFLLSPVAVLAGEETVLGSGSWSKVRASSAGEWKIVETDGSLFVVFDEKFATKKAPDLKLFLSPQVASGLTSDNVTTDALRLGPLQSHRGAQRFRIPAGTDLATFRSLAIHCEKYDELWSTAVL